MSEEGAYTPEPSVVWSYRANRPIRSWCGWTWTDRLTALSSKIRLPPSKPRGFLAVSMLQFHLDPPKEQKSRMGALLPASHRCKCQHFLRKRTVFWIAALKLSRM